MRVVDRDLRIRHTALRCRSSSRSERADSTDAATPLRNTRRRRSASAARARLPDVARAVAAESRTRCRRFCRPVVVELWGHGRSSAPSDATAYHPDGYVEAFDDIRRSLGVERWWLCGYSLGAGLTIRYALTHPDRVFGHVFTNSTSAFADTEQIERVERTVPRTPQRKSKPAASTRSNGCRCTRATRSVWRQDLYDALMQDAARLEPARHRATRCAIPTPTRPFGRASARTRRRRC